MESQSRWILGGLLALQSMFVASTFDTWMAILAAYGLSLAVVNLRLRSAERGSSTSTGPGQPTRWTIVSIACLLVAGSVSAWRLGEHLGETLNPIYLGIDVVSHDALFLSLLAWSWRPQRGHVMMLPMGVLSVMLCVAGGGTSRTLGAQTVVALCLCTAFVVASQVILYPNKHAAKRVRRVQPSVSSRRVRQMFGLLTLSLVLMATSGMAKVTMDVLPEVQDNLHERLKSTLEAIDDRTMIGGMRYVRGNKIGSVRDSIVSNPQAVALTIHADQPPGYLRGNVFDVYRPRRWLAIDNQLLRPEYRSRSYDDRLINATGPGTVKLETAIRQKLKRFRLHDQADEPVATMEIVNDPLKGAKIFTPMATHWFEANSTEIVVTHHQLIERGVDVTHPYVAAVTRDVFPETMNTDRQQLLLRIPDHLRAVLRQVSLKAVRSATTPREKAKAVERYFAAEYAYSLDRVPIPANIDPIANFLETQHPAHCEYFATATALLLRNVGVPTRYVTGYVATEYSDESLYWLARNRDAHAWVEAYDATTSKWFAVESTPGRYYRTIAPLTAGELENLQNADLQDKDEQSEDETWIGTIWSTIMSTRATDSLSVIFRLAQLPLFCIVVVLLWIRYWRPQINPVDPDEKECLRMLRRADRRAKKYRLIRNLSETLHQFADRVELAAQSDPATGSSQLESLAAWYRQYADARYRGQKPIALA